MLLKTSKETLKAFLDTCSDCEEIAPGEYVADLYDTDKPMTLDLLFTKDGVQVLAAAYLLYDEEQDGWYMGEQTENVDEIDAALHEAMKANV